MWKTIIHSKQIDKQDAITSAITFKNESWTEEISIVVLLIANIVLFYKHISFVSRIERLTRGVK